MLLVYEMGSQLVVSHENMAVFQRNFSEVLYRGIVFQI